MLTFMKFIWRVMFSNSGYTIHCGGFLGISGTSAFRIHFHVPMTKRTSSPGDHFLHSTPFVPRSTYTSLGLKPAGDSTEYAKEFKSGGDLLFATDVMEMHFERFQDAIEKEIEKKRRAKEDKIGDETEEDENDDDENEANVGKSLFGVYV